jgi:hypothetical protein
LTVQRLAFLSQLSRQSLAGSLTLGADEHDVIVRSGGSVRPRTDRVSFSSNTGDVPVTFIRTVSSPPDRP